MVTTSLRRGMGAIDRSREPRAGSSSAFAQQRLRAAELHGSEKIYPSP